MKSLFGNLSVSLKKHSLLLLLSMLLPTVGISNSVLAAEKIYASYSILEIPIPVISLEKYIKTGIIDDELAVYENYISPQQIQQLRQILQRSIKISPTVATHFLETEQGEFLLRRLTNLIVDDAMQAASNLDNLREAIISAAHEPEGLTLLNFLRKYPHSILRIDLAHSFDIFAELDKIITETNQAIATIEKLSQIEAATVTRGNNSVNLKQLSKLKAPGNFTIKNINLDFFDTTRNRHLSTDIYLPNVPHPTSVIVISHGLGLNSSNFHYLAQHLASHGLVVVVPNHPQLLIQNNSQRKSQEANEFIERPLDIKYILDQLEKANKSEPQFQGKLNLQQVGVLGQSFGGYTALALAGAKINLQQLQKDCQIENLQKTWNMSLLLQCRALDLSNKSSEENYINLRDERIKAAIAINPITSSIFGASGLNQIQTPVMFISSSEDTVAPALYEQILPFSWLNNPHKYLVTLVGATHFSTIGNSKPGSQQIPLPPDMVGNASQTHAYINALTLPFLQTYVSNKTQYLPYLHASYAQTIANQSLGLSLIQSLKTPQLEPLLGNNYQPAIPTKKNSP